jgi:hypothetical protein
MSFIVPSRAPYDWVDLVTELDEATMQGADTAMASWVITALGALFSTVVGDETSPETLAGLAGALATLILTIGQPSGICGLDSTGHVPLVNIPSVYEHIELVSSQAAMLALPSTITTYTFSAGDIAIRTDIIAANNADPGSAQPYSYMYSGSGDTLADWTALSVPSTGVQTVNGHSGATVDLIERDLPSHTGTGTLLTDLEALAPLAGPAFTGAPSSNSTPPAWSGHQVPEGSTERSQLATLDYVDSVAGSIGASVSGAISALQVCEFDGGHEGKPAASACGLRQVVTAVADGSRLLAGEFDISNAVCYTPATATATFEIYHRVHGTETDVQIGTIVFAPGAYTGTVTFSSTLTLVWGDCLTVIAPTTQDATLANITYGLVAALPTPSS